MAQRDFFAPGVAAGMLLVIGADAVRCLTTPAWHAGTSPARGMVVALQTLAILGAAVGLVVYRRRRSQRAGERTGTATTAATRALPLLGLAALLAWHEYGLRPPAGDVFASLSVGSAAPEFRVPLLVQGSLAPPGVRRWQPGRLVSLNEHRGAPVILDFWATWCEPCVVNRPAVTLLARRYADHGVVVYGVSYEERAGHVLKWLDEHGGAAYPELRDEGGQMARAYWVHGVPQMFLIGPDGLLRWHCFGCDSLPARLYPVLDSVLAASPQRSE